MLQTTASSETSADNLSMLLLKPQVVGDESNVGHGLALRGKQT